MAMRTVISRAKTKCENGGEKINYAVRCQDSLPVWRRQEVYVELPPENSLSESGRYVGKLQRAMCGTRDAPMIWQDHLRETLHEMKFKESVAHHGVFQHETRNILLCVYVDDLLCTGLREDLMWLKKI